MSVKFLNIDTPVKRVHCTIAVSNDLDTQTFKNFELLSVGKISSSTPPAPGPWLQLYLLSQTHKSFNFFYKQNDDIIWHNNKQSLPILQREF